jgi:hypothetical protein
MTVTLQRKTLVIMVNFPGAREPIRYAGPALEEYKNHTGSGRPGPGPIEAPAKWKVRDTTS